MLRLSIDTTLPSSEMTEITFDLPGADKLISLTGSYGNGSWIAPIASAAYLSVSKDDAGMHIRLRNLDKSTKYIAIIAEYTVVRE